MTHSTNGSVARACLLVAGIAGGAYCAGTAFLNGLEGAGGLAGYAMGVSGAAVAFGSWFILPEAAKLADEGRRGEALVARLGWVMCTVFVLWNATGFTALHRTEKTGNAQVSIEAYDRAAQQLTAAQSELALAKTNARWAASASCTDATVEKTKAFCAQVAVIKSNISTAQLILSKGRPGAADAPAEAIGFVLQLNPALVGKLDPVLKALVQELAMSLFLLLALRDRKKAAPAVQPTVVAAPSVDLEALLGHIDTAQAEVAAARAAYEAAAEQALLARYTALLTEAADLFVDDVEDVEGYTAPVAIAAEPVVEVVAEPVAKSVRPAKATEPVAKPKRRMRDNNGRFAKRAKLVAATETPVTKPALSALPLNGKGNVVIFGTQPKKD